MKTSEAEFKEITIDLKKMNEFKNRVRTKSLLEEDYGLIIAITERFVEMAEVINDKNMTIKKLQNLFFGHPTESSENILGKDKKSAYKKAEVKEKTKGHGRNGAEQYTGAKKIIVEHSLLKKGDTCPECIRGKLYPIKKYVITLKIFSNAPVQANAYYRNSLRCNGCGLVFIAELPEEAGTKKYDESVATMVALLKYGCVLPFGKKDSLLIVWKNCKVWSAYLFQHQHNGTLSMNSAKK